jgi:hypothetical protein
MFAARASDGRAPSPYLYITCLHNGVQANRLQEP